ncbi:MAG: hypothetical protein Q3985_01310 [Eubacteriales bacterium]|nr:hypothetical protein [Eubacteriales bacterium]
MEQREKLIELLRLCVHSDSADPPDVDEFALGLDADHLLANGVVVLPCKVGDTVYDIYEALHNGEGDVRALKVTDTHIHLDRRNKAWIIICGYYFAIDDFGKTVFLTREEAEKALAKRKGGGE